MYTVKKITSANIKGIELIYNDFYMRSFSDFGFEIQPLAFKDLSSFLDNGVLNILAIYEGSNIATGILIYAVQPDVVELSIMHTLGNENIYEKKSTLVKALKEDLKGKNYKLISYAMLGVQSNFVRKIANFGFEFVGQAIVKFKFNNQENIQVFKKATKTEIPEGYSIVNWDKKYAADIVKLINSSFEGMQDAKFDPRFATLEGCEDILAKIIQDIYGEFLPEKSKILLHNGVPKGFCLVNLTTQSVANVPLIGVDKSLKGKKLGTLLLEKVLEDVIKSVMTGKLRITEINATTDTNNLPAIKMYRHLGFKEDTNYPQAYCKL